jgi:hypothetical protein
MKRFPDPIDQPHCASSRFSRASTQCHLLWRICLSVEQLSQLFCLRQDEQLRTIVLQSKRHRASAQRLISPAGYDRNSRPSRMRRGQSLVEFAVVALVVYMLLAAILTFGHALYVAQGLQTAVDLGAREISRTPLPAMMNFDDAPNLENEDEGGAIHHSKVRRRIFDDALLVIDIDEFYANFPTDDPNGPNIFRDLVPTLPLLNQQLVTMMVVDNGLLRYPGALLTRSAVEPPDGVSFDEKSPYASPTEYKPWIAGDELIVEVPVITGRAADGSETLRWVPIVEEIDTEESPDDDTGPNADPFNIGSPQRGIVALRINYPFQSASMSSFRENDAGPFEPTIGNPNVANEADSVTAGTYAGADGLGVQLAFGQRVRPYRRVISAQAIYRREVFE